MTGGPSYRGQVAIVVALLLAAALLIAGARALAAGWAPDRSDFALQGMTIDETDGPVDWPIVAAQGVDFVYLRASAGVATRDRRFAAHWAALAHGNVRRGAVHVLSLCEPAGAQAALYLRMVPRTEDALPGVLAIDEVPDCARAMTPAAAANHVRRFLAIAERHMQLPMLIRIAPAVEARFALSRAVDRPLWAARNWFAPDYLARPWRLWQASDMRRIDGVAGPVRWSVVAP
ncbi:MULTISPECIES: glycoside hydrolase family 25 protein [unclassified Sphingomonas]|uniref:glycoside hydrolase family 25 protein n=1 Tax=unclassified Sphingomonas TaxID=196159 RepID=UPI0008325CC1|nr:MULTISPECIES: GH25 family lysozyme [unclassified Sphingomonas]